MASRVESFSCSYSFPQSLSYRHTHSIHSVFNSILTQWFTLAAITCAAFPTCSSQTLRKFKKTFLLCCNSFGPVQILSSQWMDKMPQALKADTERREVFDNLFPWPQLTYRDRLNRTARLRSLPFGQTVATPLPRRPQVTASAEEFFKIVMCWACEQAFWIRLPCLRGMDEVLLRIDISRGRKQRKTKQIEEEMWEVEGHQKGVKPQTNGALC